MNYEKNESKRIESVFNCMAGITFVVFFLNGILLAINLAFKLIER